MAQMEVSNQQTVEWYVQNVLLGSGVTASNITFNGEPAGEVNVQCGYFQSNGSYMEVESGLVLSTGATAGTNFNGDSIIVGEETTIPLDEPGVGGDMDLSDLSGEMINDQAIIEFDFVPTGDTLRFNYVFGSEEYPFYVNSFNDAFGFFLAGPGISGPFSSPAGFPDGSANIALIPGTNTPVTIDNVNNSPGGQDCPDGGSAGPCTNCEFYVDNCPIQDEAMDGMTTVLEAFALVQCGETYHIKLAIGDALDGSFDSAVFLQEGSFASDLVVSAQLFSTLGPFNDGYLYENCGSGTIVFSRQGGIEAESLVELVIEGTATNGVDFTEIPTSFTFLPGDTTYVLDIFAFLDGLDEGLEEVTVTITNTSESACASGSITSEFSFIVSDDPEPLAISVEDIDVDCGEVGEISVDVTGGYGQYVYEWSNGSNAQSQVVSPVVTTEYLITVSDTCNAGEQSAALTVTVPDYPPLVVDLGEEIQLTCLEPLTIIPVEVSGGNDTYTYLWLDGDGLEIGEDPTLPYTASSSEVISLTVMDECETEATDVLSIQVPVIPLLLSTSPDTLICKGEVAILRASASGGEPPFEFQWSYFSADETEIQVSPLETSIYEVAVTDLCENTVTDIVRVTVSESEALFAMAEQGYYGVELESFSNTIAADSLYHFWYLSDGSFYNTPDVVHDFYDLNDQTISLTVSNEHGCADSASIVVLGPPAFFVPNSFSPNDDGINDLFRVSAEGVAEYHIRIFNRWGDIVFESTDHLEPWNGSGAEGSDFYGGNSNYVYYIRARMRTGERIEERGTVTLLR